MPRRENPFRVPPSRRSDRVGRRARTTPAGSRLRWPPGTHSVVVTFIGHETTRVDGVSVGAGESTEVMITMRSQPLVLNPIVITASRRQEKALDAPASIATVSSSEIARTAATTVADHVRTVAGIDAAQTGIGSGTLVARGFNNVFSVRYSQSSTTGTPASRLCGSMRTRCSRRTTSTSTGSKSLWGRARPSMDPTRRTGSCT